MRIRDLLFPRPPLRLPRRTIRLRLTIIYASLFLASGAGLLAFTYVLVRESPYVLTARRPDGSSVTFQERENAGDSRAKGSEPSKAGRNGAPAFESRGDPREGTLTPRQSRANARTKAAQRAREEAQKKRDLALAVRQRNEELRLLLEKSGIALAVMAALSILLGWLAAGRVLRPLRTLNERARDISATSLHKRLALAGPDDELTQLAGTFDDLLCRLEASFTAQRQFVANASHELRTPLARARTLAEVAIGDPEATVGSLRASHRRVLAAGEEQERLIEALLTLARSERGLDRREPFDLAAVTDAVLAAKRPEADRRGLDLHTALEPAQTSGDPRLVERLVSNLLDNSLRHNRTRGRAEVTTKTAAGRAVLCVANSGPIISPDELERLFQPFQRLGTDRTHHSDGIGLGLSIVEAIATAHGASLSARAQPDGGLLLEVGFPSAAAADGDAVAASGVPKSHERARPRRRRKAVRPSEVPAEAVPLAGTDRHAPV